MKLEGLLGEWIRNIQMSIPTIASFCGLPDPIKLKEALESKDIVVILVYRGFGRSVRKEKWRKVRSTFTDQYWKRVEAKIGQVDKNRIQIFHLPLMEITTADFVLDSLVNHRFKLTEYPEPAVTFYPVGFNQAQYELSKSDVETHLYTLGAMTDNYFNKSPDQLEG